MKKIICIIILLIQFSISHSQSKKQIQLVYCEELVYSDITNYGPDIIGYYQLVDSNKRYSTIHGINNLLRLWHRYSFRMARNSEISYERYAKRHYLSSSCRCFNYTVEDSFAWRRSTESFKNKRFIIRDTLPISNKYNLFSNSNTALSTYLNTNYLFNILNDSIIFICIKYNGYESVFYNLNTGLEVGIYDCILDSKRNDFLGYIFDKANNHNKSVIKDISNGNISSEHGYVNYGITLMPEIGFNDNTDEMFIQFSAGLYSKELLLTYNEIEKFLKPNCFLSVVKNLIK